MRRRRKSEESIPVQMQKFICNNSKIFDGTVRLVLTPLKLVSIVKVYKKTQCFKSLLTRKNVLATFFLLTIMQPVPKKFSVQIHLLFLFSLYIGLFFSLLDKRCIIPLRDFFLIFFMVQSYWQ